jgi:hypothetical protein
MSPGIRAVDDKAGGTGLFPPHCRWVRLSDLFVEIFRAGVPNYASEDAILTVLTVMVP